MGEDAMLYYIENTVQYYMYEALLRLAQKYCKEFLLVLRTSLRQGSYAKNILAELKPYLTYEDYDSSWPGTEITGFAEINRYTLNYDTVSILTKYSSGLKSWMLPVLPEDLCFMKDRDTPWMVSTTHEGEFYFVDPSQEELEELKQIGIKVKSAGVD